MCKYFVAYIYQEKMPVRMGCYIKYECYKKGRISIFVNHNLSFVQIIKPLTLKWVTFYEFEICLKFWYLITFSYIIHRLSIEQVYKTQVYFAFLWHRYLYFSLDTTNFIQ